MPLIVLEPCEPVVPPPYGNKLHVTSDLTFMSQGEQKVMSNSHSVHLVALQAWEPAWYCYE